MKYKLLILFLFCLAGSVDIYFVRHGARAPLVVPMKNVFGVDPRKLTNSGRIQSYYYGKEIYARHFKTLPKLLVYSTNYERTLKSAQYFLKGWYGIKKKGNYSFNPDPKFRPPCNISIYIQKEHHLVDEYQYASKILDLPYIPDITGRHYRRYRIAYRRTLRVLEAKIKQNKNLCKKFQSQIPGSCKRGSVNQFFNFVDVLNCLRFQNKTVRNVSQKDMRFPLSLVDETFDYKFRQKSFPIKSTQQDFLLIQDIYQNKKADVVVVFTHDSQIFYFLRTLLGIKEIKRMFGGHFVMNFLSSIRIQLNSNVAKLYYEDKQFIVPECGSSCTIKRLFHIMNN